MKVWHWMWVTGNRSRNQFMSNFYGGLNFGTPVVVCIFFGRYRGVCTKLRKIWEWGHLRITKNPQTSGLRYNLGPVGMGQGWVHNAKMLLEISPVWWVVFGFDFLHHNFTLVLGIGPSVSNKSSPWPVSRIERSPAGSRWRFLTRQWGVDRRSFALRSPGVSIAISWVFQCTAPNVHALDLLFPTVKASDVEKAPVLRVNPVSTPRSSHCHQSPFEAGYP